jgi:hypothetical protein
MELDEDKSLILLALPRDLLEPPVFAVRGRTPCSRNARTEVLPDAAQDEDKPKLVASCARPTCSRSLTSARHITIHRSLLTCYKIAIS